MRDLSLKIILNDGAVTRVIKFPSRATGAEACRIVQEKVLTGEDGKDFGLFLPSADDVLSGIWLDDNQLLSHYLLRDGDSLHYRSKVRTLRLRTLDGAVKTMQMDESKPVESLMMSICARLGITNYEEYGLCREEVPEEVAKPATGTLTLKRKPKTREKDLAMDQLSKKLKTDDNVEWLEQHKTLRESNIPPAATLLLARRLFYSDRKVDTRDPTQLRLLYVQARDGVLGGRHPVTEARAVEFAGIQCQIQFGDHQDNKHKPGLIEDLNEFLPAAYASSRGVEKKILKEHKKHVGLSDVEAQLLYTKTVRGLPTYGVTFFLVKEILEGKKKLVPRLLGISANAVLRMDEKTKEVLNEWPLTQVRTYKAGKGELFTLNFGDYREKEYCVKTNDAHRIRDILQSYIDLIRKKMEAPFNATADDGGAIYTATVESSKGNTMEVVSHGANKAVETTFVGPSRIISYEHGSTAQAQGAQIMTAQQVIVMSQHHNQQTAHSGGVALRNANDLSAGTVRRLNDLNGRAVRIVELLTEPNDDNVSEAKKIIEGIEEGMPELVEGVKQCIDKQMDDQGRQLLTSQLQDLQDTVAQLVQFKSPEEAKEAAMRVADLTTQMYFALDPRTKRRSQLVKLSRKSFVDDERTQATLQRASFINTVAGTSEAIGDARDLLIKQYEGKPLSPEEVTALERSSRDRLAKLNAAIALFVAAHSDPKNIDYAAAVNSMNIIKELMPELAKDTQALSAVQDGTDRSQLLQQMKDLCDAAELICRHTGCDDLEKLHGAADDYAKKSKRLLFTFSRGVPPPQQNEILELAKEADDRARLLLSTAAQLAAGGDGHAADTLRGAAARCGDAASGLRACAELTASSIHEPHCRSALAAASEDLASSARALANACGPLTSPEGQDTVKQQTNDILKALERLNNAIADVVDADSPEACGRRRLQFTNTLSDAQAALAGCDAILDDDKAPAAPGSWLGDSLPKRLAALDAAVAALLKATRDSENPDYEAAEAAMATIQRLMPGVVRDVKWDSHRLPEGRRRALQADLRALRDALQALAQDTRDGKDTSDSVAEFARASGKLAYVFDRRAKPDREHRIIDLAKSSCQTTSDLLSPVYQVAEATAAEVGARLDTVGADVADSAQTLLTTALLTAPTCHITPAKDALMQSAQDLMDAMNRLAHAWAPVQPDQRKELDARKHIADEELRQLLAALNEIPDEISELKEDPIKQRKRVRFMFSLSQTADAVDKAGKDIDKAVSSPVLTSAQERSARSSLADKLAALNAAVAALATATRDRSNPDYEAVETASAAIQQLLPQVIQETKALSAGKDEAEQRALLDDLRALCAATKDLSSGAGDYVTLPSDGVQRYAGAAARLAGVCTPRAQAQGDPQQVLQKSNAVDEQSRELLAAAEKIPGAAGAARGAAAASQALRDAVRLTSSSLHSPHCRSALLQAASELSQAVATLDEACGRPGQASALATQRAAFDKAVEELMASIRRLDGSQDVAELSPEQEKCRLRFVATQRATEKALDDAARELAKAGKSAPLAPPQANALQLSLSDRLATLNAAVAALLTATRDTENPDYSAAESATATVQELMPDLVKDAKSLSASKDSAARDKFLENLRNLCEATKLLNGGELRGKEQELNDAVKKFTTASGNLVYTFNPRAGSSKEDQIIDLSKSTCEKTSELLAQVYELAERVDGAKADALDSRGARVADAAQSLLTTAEITAPSIASPLCQSSLLASVDGLSSSVEQLAVSWQPSQPLDLTKTRVDEEIARLRDAIRSGHIGDTEAQRERLRLTNSLASTKAAVDAAEKALDEPSGAPLSPASAAALRGSLADKLAALNAAINSLVAASRDEQNPDYTMAESATTTIRELLPDIIKDTKALSNSKDPASREELLGHVRALCGATRRIGAGAGQASPQELNDAASQFSLASGKLTFVFRPHADQERAHQIIESCKAACTNTSEMLQHTHSLSVQDQNEAMDRHGAIVSDAARALLTTAQLTAHTAHSSACQQALLEAADNLQSSLQGLQATWSPVTKDPRFKSEGAQLEKDKHAVEVEIKRLKCLVKESKEVKGKTPPAVPTRPVSRARAGNEPAAVALTKDFLDALRKEASSEGSYDRAASPVIARAEEERRAKSRFSKSVEDARQSIGTAEEGLVKYLHSESKPRASLDDAQIRALNKQMEHKLARANAAAAHLLASRSGEKSDYTVAAKCVGAVSDLLPTIVTDAKTLGDLKDAQGRKAFLDDTLALCTASLKLCETAKSDKKKLTDAALAFGNQTSKLLYAVSTDVDPSQENEVLVRVRVAGDAAVRLTERGGDQRTSGRCAGLATVLMYTAKLVAPSIQDPECQGTLISASKDLSTQLRTFPADQPELSAELADLEALLEALRNDVAGGKLVKMRERLVIEDTPLKRLTEQIIEYAKQNAESPARAADERRALATFANKLTDALTAFDVANARCKNAPHDMKRRGELEDAVYNLQHLVLQERPGAAQNNIVDLAEYLTAVTSDASSLLQATQSPGLTAGPAARTAAAVGQQAERICSAAEKAHSVGEDVDHAVEECVSRVQKINTAVECCAEGAEKNILKKETRPLNESCALLQFAAQSAHATAQCAALDEAISDLAELERRIDAMLLPGETPTPAQVGGPSGALVESRARLGAAAAGVGAGAGAAGARGAAPAFTRYLAALRARAGTHDPATRRRLSDHLKKLQNRLKLLAMETGRHLQTWQPIQDSTLPAEQVLQELDNMEAVLGLKPATTAGCIANEDLRKLLLPAHSYAVEGDSKQLEAKLESSATKLNSMLETIALSLGKPESLARTAHVTSESAVQLAAIARAMKTDEDPSKSSKIEETSQELCFVTYNLLKTAESVSQEPNSFESRRRLRDACRSLTDAINKLVKTSSNADRLHKECNELSRSLQLHGLQARPTCALSYGDCMAAIHTQHDTIQNLKSDKPMSREEFSTSFQLLSSAVHNNVEYAEHCAYLLSIAAQHPTLAKEGMFDATRVQSMIAATQDTCFKATRSGIEYQAKEESSLLSKQLADLKQAVEESSATVKDAAVKQQLLEASSRVEAVGGKLKAMLNTENVTADKLTQPAFAAVEALSALEAVTRHPALAPLPEGTSKPADEVLDHSKELVGRATALMRAVKMADSQQAMTWVMFNTYSKGVVEASDQLITCLKTNGQNAGVLEAVVEVEEETDVAFKSYVQTQVAIANKWLSKPAYKAQIKADGEEAARNVIDVGKKMATHLKDGEAEEMRHLADECEHLLIRCREKYDLETGSLLMDRLKDLARAVDRCIVSMVVEDLMEDEEPMADLDILIDAETDEAKRKYVLERKIKDLLAHLARVTKTARALADGRGGAPDLLRRTDQTALLAPMLVKAAEKRIIFPQEKAVAEDYQRQLAQYSESLSRVRDLCDTAVDPMQFVQTAEEKMQRMKEESTVHQNDLQKCSNTSTAIRNLAHRVIHVSMSSASAQRDPDLMRALAQAQRRLHDAEPARTVRASKMPDWNNSIAEILRATGEVESVLGGEMIFNKLPEPDQPIYNAARNLHAAVRDWSARDNEIVSEAKRMAVLMAKLSDYMHADKKREVISTSKAIVAASHEVARLARKLALECTDMRIRTNLLQLCDQILTISAQLKMLSNVKKSSFGHQGNEEDIEAMNMLVGNAQNLMLTIQNTVDASFGASVQIRSKLGGPRIRWVRKNYRPDAHASVLTF